jgi:hypothetical protein
MATCAHARTKRRRPAVLTARGMEVAAATDVECQDCRATWQEWPDGRRSAPAPTAEPPAPPPDPDVTAA